MNAEYTQQEKTGCSCELCVPPSHLGDSGEETFGQEVDLVSLHAFKVRTGTLFEVEPALN